MKSPEQRALAERCTRIDYHRTHRIQPHFVMVVLDANLTVLRVSDNAELLFGEPAGELVGRPFLQIVDGNLKGALDGLRVASRGRLAIELVVRWTHRRSDALLFRSGGYICCELELASSDDRALPLLALQLGAAIVDSEADPETLAGFVCGLLQRITGFDRTYYCEFDAEGNGYVSGEHLAVGLASLMEHRFPASDIPANIRPIYVLNRFRCIADATAAPSVLTADADGGPTDLDLTYSLSRQPAPTHVTYLANMGVRGSTSFSVVRNGKLAALFGGHSVAPLALRYRQLAVCQQLVESYVHRHTVLDRGRTEQRRDAKLAAVKSVVGQLGSVDCAFAPFIEAASKQLCGLTDSDGLVGYVGGTLFNTSGLEEAQARRLVACAADLLRAQPIWSTNSLRTIVPDLGDLAKHASGVLAVAFGRDAADLLMWTRVEHDYDARWSGNPSQAVRVDDQGDVGPRRSFETWVESVSGTARAWPADTLMIASLFRDGVNQLLATHYQTKAVEVAQEASAQKNQFIANVSHELRTPMHSILGFAEVLLDKLDSMPRERQRHLLGAVLASGQRLLGLINELLDLSSLEAGQMAFHFQRGTILTAVERAVTEASGKLAAKAITVTIEGNDVDPYLTFDLQRTVQVLVNLLANAANASEAGQPITLRLRDELDRRCLRIEVVDRGVGIPEHQLERVFEKFIQSERTANGPGSTGLGLSISRQIVASHGGRIWAANNPDGGATVVVEYPREPNGA